MTDSDPLKRMLNERVVLDTATPILYVGKLIEVTSGTFVLEEADMHDCRDGHATKEGYIGQIARDAAGEATVNRRHVCVMKTVVISVSRLADVVSD